MQIDNSTEQDFLFHEKEIIYPAVVNVIYELKNLSRTQKKSQQNLSRISAKSQQNSEEISAESQQNSEEIEWSTTLVGMPTFTMKEIEKHRQLSGKIQGLRITKTLVRGRKFNNERFLTAGSIYTTKTKNLF